MSINFTINTLILTKKIMTEYLNERDEQFFEPNQFKILGKKKQKSESTEENTEMQRSLWFEIDKFFFKELTGDIYTKIVMILKLS